MYIFTCQMNHKCQQENYYLNFLVTITGKSRLDEYVGSVKLFKEEWERNIPRLHLIY